MAGFANDDAKSEPQALGSDAQSDAADRPVEADDSSSPFFRQSEVGCSPSKSDKSVSGECSAAFQPCASLHNLKSAVLDLQDLFPAILTHVSNSSWVVCLMSQGLGTGGVRERG